MINYKETRMVKDGEDSQGLQTTNLKLGLTLQDVKPVTCCLINVSLGVSPRLTIS